MTEILLKACVFIASTTNNIHTIKATESLTLRSEGKALLVWRCPYDAVERIESELKSPPERMELSVEVER